MAEVVVVAIDSPWPIVNGSRSRMAGISEALAAEHDVTVVVAHGRRLIDVGQPPSGVRVVHLQPARRSRAAAALGLGPRLGRGLLDRAGGARIAELAATAKAVVATHSYLVPQLPPLEVPLVVDVPNLELARQRSAACTGSLPTRSLHAIEAAKALRWEPRAMRRAALCLAVDRDDAAVLDGWGARSVVVPNASRDAPVGPSPDDGYVLAVGDWSYRPNGAALERLLDRVWPRVRAAMPTARLVLAGRGLSRSCPDGVDALGVVPDLAQAYVGAAVAVSLVDSGAGTQLKVVDAVARGRVIVVTPYGARSLPAGSAGLCPVATDDASAATHLVAVLRDIEDRHRREDLLRAAGTSWSAATEPLVSWLRAL